MWLLTFPTDVSKNVTIEFDFVGKRYVASLK